MIRWDDAQTIMQSLGNDPSADSLTFLKLMANQGYKMVLSEFDSEQIEEERTIATVADTRSYQLPVDATWVSTLTIEDGTTKYPLTEVKSRTTWDRMTSNQVTGIPEFYFYQPRKGIGGGLLLLDPIPGSVYDLVITMETTGKDLKNDAYTTGTAAATQDSATVTGTGTTWTAPMVGRYIRFTGAGADGLWYKISAFVSTTEITLENYYQGEDYSTAAYEIAEMFELPEDLHMAPIYYSLWHYYASRRDKGQAAIYKNLYDQVVEMGHNRHANKTRDNDIVDYSTTIKSDYPDYFPSDGVT